MSTWPKSKGLVQNVNSQVHRQAWPPVVLAQPRPCTVRPRAYPSSTTTIATNTTTTTVTTATTTSITTSRYQSPSQVSWSAVSPLLFLLLTRMHRLHSSFPSPFSINLSLGTSHCVGVCCHAFCYLSCFQSCFLFT